MKLPVIEGTIRRRLLVNFRADPGAIARRLPPRFTPKLREGHAVALPPASQTLRAWAHARPYTPPIT